MKCPSKKLDYRHLGPYLITSKISSHAFQLGLPLDLRQIHFVFHVSLLEPATESKIKGRIPTPCPQLKFIPKMNMKLQIFLIVNSEENILNTSLNGKDMKAQPKLHHGSQANMLQMRHAKSQSSTRHIPQT